MEITIRKRNVLFLSLTLALFLLILDLWLVRYFSSGDFVWKKIVSDIDNWDNVEAIVETNIDYPSSIDSEYLISSYKAEVNIDTESDFTRLEYLEPSDMSGILIDFSEDSIFEVENEVRNKVEIYNFLSVNPSYIFEEIKESVNNEEFTLISTDDNIYTYQLSFEIEQVNNNIIYKSGDYIVNINGVRNTRNYTKFSNYILMVNDWFERNHIYFFVQGFTITISYDNSNVRIDFIEIETSILSTSDTDDSIEYSMRYVFSY